MGHPVDDIGTPQIQETVINGKTKISNKKLLENPKINIRIFKPKGTLKLM